MPSAGCYLTVAPLQLHTEVGDFELGLVIGLTSS